MDPVAIIVCTLVFVLSTLYIVWQRRKNIIFLILKFGMRFVGSLKHWYALTQLLSPKNKRMPIPANYVSIEEITKELRSLPYEYDPDVISGINFDTISHPRFIYWLAVANMGSPPGQMLGKGGLFEERKGGDCDDSAAVWCAALEKNKKELKIEKVMFGVVLFEDTRNESRSGAHAVCVFKDSMGRYGNVGNWFGNVPQYSRGSEGEGLKTFTDKAGSGFKFLSGALLDVVSLTKDDRLVFGDARIVK